jgi:chromosome segregation ATPase
MKPLSMLHFVSPLVIIILLLAPLKLSGQASKGRNAGETKQGNGLPDLSPAQQLELLMENASLRNRLQQKEVVINQLQQEALLVSETQKTRKEHKLEKQLELTQQSLAALKKGYEERIERINQKKNTLSTDYKALLQEYKALLETSRELEKTLKTQASTEDRKKQLARVEELELAQKKNNKRIQELKKQVEQLLNAQTALKAKKDSLESIVNSARELRSSFNQLLTQNFDLLFILTELDRLASMKDEKINISKIRTILKGISNVLARSEKKQAEQGGNSENLESITTEDRNKQPPPDAAETLIRKRELTLLADEIASGISLPKMSTADFRTMKQEDVVQHVRNLEKRLRRWRQTLTQMQRIFQEAEVLWQYAETRKKQFDLLLKEMTQLSADKRKLQEDKEALSERVRRLKSINEQSRRFVSKQQSRIDELQSELSAHKRRHEDVTTHNQHLSAVNEKLEKEAQNISRQNDSLKLRLKNLRRLLRTYERLKLFAENKLNEDHLSKGFLELLEAAGLHDTPSMAELKALLNNKNVEGLNIPTSVQKSVLQIIFHSLAVIKKYEDLCTELNFTEPEKAQALEQTKEIEEKESEVIEE